NIWEYIWQDFGICIFLLTHTVNLIFKAWSYVSQEYKILKGTNGAGCLKILTLTLHSQLGLAIISILISVKEAELTFLKEKTNATAGNLSVQIQKLKKMGYINVIKYFKDNYPQTIFKITKQGVKLLKYR
ncbi:MAG TPA: transcriptional regulator, partial [Chitinophagaceae bacterium]|nr:transcriptional regulator [Chitinophagaceae bacterium]